MAHLRLVCDHDIPASITDWLRDAPGRHRVTTAIEKGWDRLDDPDLLREATDDRRILITMDKEFCSYKKYPICTHAGILVISQGENQTKQDCIDMLNSFFLSGMRGRVHHAIVILTEQYIEIIDSEGVERII